MTVDARRVTAEGTRIRGAGGRRNATTAIRAVVFVLLIAAAALTLVPMVWLLAAALKSPDDLFHYTFFAPRLSGENFVDLFKKMPFFRYLMNSVFVSTTTVIIQLFFSSLAGFALAKYEFKGKRVLMVMMLATMMIPAQVTMAPLYELIYRLGLVDTHLGIIIPGAVSVFGIFLFRQSMLQVPTELIHAARIDGCTEFRIYWDVIMPISRPMVGAFCLISFMASWNSFLWPQILLHTSSRFTLPIGLTQLVGLYGQDYGTMLAGTLLSVLPVLVLFMLLQKEFVAGLTAGAVKG
jgi:multiple sugar transport system permease protein